MKTQLMFWGAVLIAVVHGSSPSFNPDGLSREQAAAVSQLRELVKNEVTENFMTEDYCLAKILNKAEFNVDQAEKLFRSYLETRVNKKMDSILKEDFGDLRVRFPFTRATFDKHGRPVLYRDLSHWAVNKYLQLAGDAGVARLGRYMLYMLEDSSEHVRQLRAQGRNITSYDYIINAAEFSFEQHIPKDLADIAYPSGLSNLLDIEKMVIINAPSAIDQVLNKLDAELRSLITVYGQDQGPWEEYLAEFLDHNQFPPGILGKTFNKDNNNGLMHF